MFTSPKQAASAREWTGRRTAHFPGLARWLILLAVALSGCTAALPAPTLSAPAPVPSLTASPTPRRSPTAAPLHTPARAPAVTPTGADPATPTPAPIATSPAHEDLVAAAQIDAYLSDLTSQGLFSGSVLVARAGRVILAKGYGQADRGQGLPNTPQTRFRLASLTKQFTAAAILLLQERGRVYVQDPACRYLKDCPAEWQDITIHHLLTHTAGLPNYLAFFDYSSTQAIPVSPGQLMSRFDYRPLDFAPGEGWNYSNSGYIVLGQIIEKASGQSYADFLQQNIFSPLGMSSSGYNPGASDLAVGYKDQSDSPADPTDPSTLYAAGGLYSTIEDLYRWDQALYTGKLLPPALLAAMFTPYATAHDSNNASSSYGYGWFVGKENGRRMVWHGGRLDGVSTYIARYPDQRAVVSVLSNQDNVNAAQVGAAVAGLMLGEN